MALNKVTYVNKETVIEAKNLNDIQDSIIENTNTIKQVSTVTKELAENIQILSQKSNWAENDETSNSYIENRTHYMIEKGYSIEWNGDLSIDPNPINPPGEGQEDFTVSFVYISDIIPTNEELQKSFLTLTAIENSITQTYTLSLEEIWEDFQDYITEDYATLEYFLITRKDNIEIEGITFPKAGTYFALSQEHNSENNTYFTAYCSSLIKKDIAKKLDSTFLPDTIVGRQNNNYGEIFNNYELNQAPGQYSHAEGEYTLAGGQGSHSEGFQVQAQGKYAHAEGYYTSALGDYSHTECGRIMRGNLAEGQSSHAEGCGTKALGVGSHAEGGADSISTFTIAEGNYSHAEGEGTTAKEFGSHSEGCYTVAEGRGSHSEGDQTKAKGNYSHTEGSNTIAYGFSSHAEGSNTIAHGADSHAEGYGQQTSYRVNADANATTYSFASSSTTWLTPSNRESYAYYNDKLEKIKSFNVAQQSFTVENSLSENELVDEVIPTVEAGIAFGDNSHSDRGGIAIGENSFASGKGSIANEKDSTIFGTYNIIPEETYNINIVKETKLYYSDAKVGYIIESYEYDPQEGNFIITGLGSAVTYNNTEIGKTYIQYNFSSSYFTDENGIIRTSNLIKITNKSSSFALLNDTYCEIDYDLYKAGSTKNVVKGKYALTVGNGNSHLKRSNAYTLDWNGNGWYSGSVEVDHIILRSSTENSTKKFKITVDDNGILSTTEIIE